MRFFKRFDFDKQILSYTSVKSYYEVINFDTLSDI